MTITGTRHTYNTKTFDERVPQAGLPFFDTRFKPVFSRRLTRNTPQAPASASTSCQRNKPGTARAAARHLKRGTASTLGQDVLTPLSQLFLIDLHAGNTPQPSAPSRQAVSATSQALLVQQNNQLKRSAAAPWLKRGSGACKARHGYRGFIPPLRSWCPGFWYATPLFPKNPAGSDTSLPYSCLSIAPSPVVSKTAKIRSSSCSEICTCARNRGEEGVGQ